MCWKLSLDEIWVSGSSTTGTLSRSQYGVQCVWGGKEVGEELREWGPKKVRSVGQCKMMAYCNIYTRRITGLFV